MAAQTGADIKELRDGMRTVLQTTLTQIVREHNPDGVAPRAQIDALEAAANGSAIRRSRAGPRHPYRQLYVETMRAVSAALPTQAGPYPDEIFALMFLDGRLTAAEAVEKSLAPADPEAPREIIRRLFLKQLMQASPTMTQDKTLALETARKVEVSCYNAAVRASKESEEPPRRQWDSTAFVDIYSTRCGTIAVLLNPESSPCKAYGGRLAERLLGGPDAINPEELGDLTEKDLCPTATEHERREIAKRSEQKVKEKESNLFRCPHCDQRRSVYREVQRRSLDEAPDYLCRCLNEACGRHFTGRS